MDPQLSKYQYVEYDGVVYRGAVPAVTAPIVRMTEMAVNGKWVPAYDGHAASRMGNPLEDETEAQAEAGKNWPTDAAASEPTPVE